MLKTQKTPYMVLQIEETNGNSVQHEVVGKEPSIWDEIVIRKAEKRDTEEIWELLHSEGKLNDNCKLEAVIQDLYILTYREKVLGVLSGRATGQKLEINWSAVHPLYPENSIEAAMKTALLGVVTRQPL